MSTSWFFAETAAMAESEKIDKRPACDWQPKRKADDRTPCGSEQDIFAVKHHGWSGQPLEANICGKHLSDAWGKLRVDSAEKRQPPSRTTGLIALALLLLALPARASDLTRSHDAYCPGNAKAVTLAPNQTYVAGGIWSPAASGVGDAVNHYRFQFSVKNLGTTQWGSYEYQSGVTNSAEFACPMKPWEGDEYEDIETDDIAPLKRAHGITLRADYIDEADSGCWQEMLPDAAVPVSWLMANGSAGNARPNYPMLIGWVTNVGPTNLQVSNVCLGGDSEPLLGPS